MRWAIIGLTLTFSTAALAAAPPCKLESAVGDVVYRDASLEAKSAEAMRSVLREIQNLAEKAKNPKISIGKQLSVKDAERFTQLTEQLKSVRISNLIESDHARDAEVVGKMHKTAWSFFANPNSKLEENDVPGNVLFLMRYLFKGRDINLNGPKSGDCTIENALLSEEKTSGLRASNDPNVSRDVPILSQLKQKYGITGDTKFDFSKMDPDDVRTLSRINVEMHATIQEYNLAEDMHNIIEFWRVSNRVYEDRKQDILTYGADPSSIDKTLDDQKSSLDDQTKTMLGLWYKVSEKVPSDQQKMMKILSDSAEQILKKYPVPAQ